MNKRMILALLGLTFIVGLGHAGDPVTVAVSPGAENVPAVVRPSCLAFIWTAAAIENFNLTEDPLSQQMIDIEGTEGSSNTFYGLDAGNGTMSGLSNSFFGRYAGNSNGSGYSNTFMGRAAGRMNTSGYENTFLGYLAGNHNTSGRWNTFVGSSTGTDQTTGGRNTFVGAETGTKNTDGWGNSFFGSGAGAANTNGDYNTIIGEWAGHANQTGYDNVYIGDYAGANNVSGYGNVFIGNEAGQAVTGSNKLYIANSSTSTLIFGDFNTKHVGINNTAPGYMLVVGTSNAYCDGGAWVDGSSREVKENIEELTSAEAQRAFEKLEPVKFNYKENKDETYLGFIAEDVPDLVATNDRKGLSPMDMVAMLTKVVQEQQKAISDLREEVAKLKDEVKKEK